MPRSFGSCQICGRTGKGFECEYREWDGWREGRQKMSGIRLIHVETLALPEVDSPKICSLPDSLQ
jgi:hypothetical protein